MYTRILVPIDGSPASDAGLEEALRLARLSGGALRMLHVVEVPPWIPEASAHAQWPADQRRAAMDHGRALLGRACERARVAGIDVDSVFWEADDHRLEEHVAREVGAWPADIVVMGTHGRRGAGRLVLGSDAEQVLRTTKVPVLLVRHEDARHGVGARQSGTSR